jgi:3-hydroxyacyl-CoA dehydrogenase
MLTIETVAVIGPDYGLALVAPLAGCTIRICIPDPTEIAPAFESVRRRVDLAVAAGALTPTERQRILDGVILTSDLAEAITGADLAADLDQGPRSVGRLVEMAAHVRATTVLAVAFPPGHDVAAGVPQAGRVLALAFAPTGGPMPRVESVPLPTTSPHAAERAAEFIRRVNRAARTGR